jgi:CheY-like chemotaxis protein
MRRHCVLHVDDDPDDAFLFARALRKRCPGIRLLHAASGEEAMEKLESVTGEILLPELLVLDLKMTGLGGVDVLQWLRKQERFKHVKVVILSGGSLEQDRRRTDGLGVTAHVVKTSDWHQVASVIAQILEPAPAD